MMDETKLVAGVRTKLTRLGRPILLVIGLLLLAFVCREKMQSIGKVTGDTLSSQIPKVMEADISADELSDIVDSLVRTHRWFQSLPFGRIEYQVTVTKSDMRYESDIAGDKASFPSMQVDEGSFPDLAREWKIDQSVTFDESRYFCVSRSNALGDKTEVWDGSVLTGYVDHGPTQEPNYYFRSNVGGAVSNLAWFPQVGTSTIWFYDATAVYDGLDWQETPPTLAGATHFADRECVVLRDVRHHWIVGREDHKLYGRYSRHDWEQFDQHREVTDGVYWPMASIRKRYNKEELEWIDQTFVTSMELGDMPEDSVFTLEMESGVKVCDMRNDYPVVFESDPKRTEEELTRIYAEARKKHEHHSARDRRSQELIGKEAPKLGSGKWLNSQPMSLSELRGKRSALLGFGYTGCAPCANLLALFARLQETSTDQLILVFAASDTVSDVEKTLDLYSLKCPTFIPSDSNGFGEAFARYRIAAYPTLVAIDGTGTVTMHQIGTLVTD